MEIRTVLLIVLAVIAALTIVFYQYFYKARKRGKLSIILASLRFCALFGALLLLINPKFKRNEYSLEKANLIVLVDDSSSIQDAAEEIGIKDKVNSIVENQDLNKRFSIQQYSFGNQVKQIDSFSFSENNTDISNALNKTGEIFSKSNTSIVIFTDGNQTLGRDYDYIDLDENIAVNPIVVGDTTKYEDISIGLINTNTYAFLKNKFPVEATVLYNGRQNISKTVSILMDGKRVHSETINFNQDKSSATINAELGATSVGVKSIELVIENLTNEKNKSNNRKVTAIEVIDEKTNIAIVSGILHPDIGTLKKAIETNEQRSVSIVKPSVQTNRLSDIDVFILYQPNSRFRNIYRHIEKVGASIFTIAGTKTDWNFLNQSQQNFSKENYNQSEEVLPVLNKTFNVFGLGDFNVSEFPPLEGNLGDIQLNKEGETLLYQQIRGAQLDKPLFSILNGGEQKEAILFGENIWKWRAQTYRTNQNFKSFDDFIGKLMLYLSSSGTKSRLELDYDFIFDDSSFAKVRASYFDEGYSFDANANIKIEIRAKENNRLREYPMLLKGTFFEADLSDLQAGDYQFTVTVNNENLKRSGAFKILDFNPEKQLVTANYDKLKRLAKKTDGTLYSPNDIDSLIDDLSTSSKYVPVQKSKQNVVSLIDFRLLLGLIIFTLLLEWFIRKYNGLT
ncbi:VWA domain-containing protein [Flagellimonas sp. HMM57]|uniref:VWA domain-containing protein n=1 Tax=unclassified Flagellimonas TaxID=2644544 RepID=UPI0013D67164|nr:MULTISPECIES: VWA domain-containing protein [unclassified Flagellimonas]UII75921.1 VWA domain-containing protein [Flagellimonas sp. HMM57]